MSNKRIPEFDAPFERYWECAICGAPSTEYTDHVICFECATGDDGMTGPIVFNFFSDTNQKLALDELQLLGLDDMTEDTFAISIGQEDYDALGVAIDTIMDEYGAEMEM